MRRCRYLGINGLEFTADGKTLLVDPYVSRTPKTQNIVCRPDVVRRHIPRADYIVLTHSHYDHLGDVPEIASYTGALVCGSETTLNICRYFGVPEDQLVRFEAHRAIELAPFAVTPIPSLHKQPMKTAGAYEHIPARVASHADYPEGGTWALLLQIGEISVFNLGSANFIEHEISGTRCDYLFLAIAGRTPEFVPRVLSSVTAEYVVPTHWDLFRSQPVKDAGEKYSTEEFVREVRRVSPEQKVVVMQVLEELGIYQGGAPDDVW